MANLKAVFDIGTKFRVSATWIRFNVDSLNDRQIVNLGVLSVHRACEVKVKRSGTGLLVVITL